MLETATFQISTHRRDGSSLRQLQLLVQVSVWLHRHKRYLKERVSLDFNIYHASGYAPSLAQWEQLGCSLEHLSFRFRQDLHAGRSSLIA